MNKKKSVLTVLLCLVFLVVFNVVFFVLGGTDHKPAVWLSYAFIHVAYFMVLITPFLTRKGKNAYVFGVTLGGISSAYFIVEFLIGIIFMILKHDSLKVDVVVHVVITGLYLVTLISNMIANETTADNIERHDDEVAFIKNASSRIKLLVDKLDDKKANRVIEQAYDLVHSSPSKSSAAAKSYEYDVMNRINDLESAVSSKDIEQSLKFAGEIVSLMEERNRIVRSGR